MSAPRRGDDGFVRETDPVDSYRMPLLEHLRDLRKRVTRERWLTIDVADGTAESVADADASVIRREGERVCLAFDPEVVSPADLIQRVTSRHAVRDLFVENPPIETVIARLYQR